MSCFSSDGYARTTTKRIAECAGVATGTLYQYFPDKDALLHEIARRRIQNVPDAIVERVDAQTEAIPDAAEAEALLEGLVGFVMRMHQTDPGLHAVLSERRYEDAELDKLIATSERRLVRGIAQLLERWKHPGDPLAASFILCNMVEGSVHAHVLGQPVVDDERFRKALTESVLKLARHG